MNSDPFAFELTTCRVYCGASYLQTRLNLELERSFRGRIWGGGRFQARPIVNVQAQTGLAEHLELAMSVA